MLLIDLLNLEDAIRRDVEDVNDMKVSSQSHRYTVRRKPNMVATFRTNLSAMSLPFFVKFHSFNRRWPNFQLHLPHSRLSYGIKVASFICSACTIWCTCMERQSSRLLEERNSVSAIYRERVDHVFTLFTQPNSLLKRRKRLLRLWHDFRTSPAFMPFTNCSLRV